jgi:hypothetical protein
MADAKIIKYPNDQEFDKAVSADEPLLVLVSFDGSEIIAAQIDEAFEHTVLLRKDFGTDKDIDKYFRLVVNSEGADWTFVCPVSYNSITRKDKQIESFFKDGMDIIPKALKQLGYDVPVEIPKRYRRHSDRCKNP